VQEHGNLTMARYAEMQDMNLKKEKND
jgi:hypothetical protein